jgi:hypothetical protein
MLLNLAIAALLLVVTTAIHAGGMILAMHTIESRGGRLRQRLLRIRHYSRVAEIVLLMFLASVLEVLVWAVTYLAVNGIQGFEQALYFSMVTFTTLGYGDIVLDERWRLLSSFEAANGIIMFGWTTAVVIAAVQRVYFGEKPESGDAGSGNK